MMRRKVYEAVGGLDERFGLELGTPEEKSEMGIVSRELEMIRSATV